MPGTFQQLKKTNRLKYFHCIFVCGKWNHVTVLLQTNKDPMRHRKRSKHFNWRFYVNWGVFKKTVGNMAEWLDVILCAWNVTCLRKHLNRDCCTNICFRSTTSCIMCTFQMAGWCKVRSHPTMLSDAFEFVCGKLIYCNFHVPKHKKKHAALVAWQRWPA